MRETNKYLHQAIENLRETQAKLIGSQTEWKKNAEATKVELRNVAALQKNTEAEKQSLEIRVQYQNSMLKRTKFCLEKVNKTIKKQKKDIAHYKEARKRLMQTYFNQEQKVESVVEDEINAVDNFSAGVMRDLDRTLSCSSAFKLFESGNAQMCQTHGNLPLNMRWNIGSDEKS